MSDTPHMLLHLHVREIERKASMVLGCVPSLNKCLQSDQISFDIFFYLHAILFNASAVSLSFWPSRSSLSGRGEALRRGFKLPEEIDKLRDRSLRNHIVHFDERLDDWYEQSQSRNIAHCVIGPRNMIGGSSINAADIFDHYVPEEKVYIFRGDEYDISGLINCVATIRERASQLGQLHWADEAFGREFS